jgi:hypothetical protein
LGVYESSCLFSELFVVNFSEYNFIVSYTIIVNTPNKTPEVHLQVWRNQEHPPRKKEKHFVTLSKLFHYIKQKQIKIIVMLDREIQYNFAKILTSDKEFIGMIAMEKGSLNENKIVSKVLEDGYLLEKITEDEFEKYQDEDMEEIFLE